MLRKSAARNPVGAITIILFVVVLVFNFLPFLFWRGSDITEDPWNNAKQHFEPTGGETTNSNCDTDGCSFLADTNFAGGELLNFPCATKVTSTD